MGMIEGGHIFSTNHKGDHKKLVGVVIGNKVYATDDYKHYETLVGFIEGDAIYGCNKDGKDPHQVGTTRGGGGACGARRGDRERPWRHRGATAPGAPVLRRPVA